MNDIRCLRSPGRDRSQTRDNHETLGRSSNNCFFTVVEDRCQRVKLFRGKSAVYIDKMNIAAVESNNFRTDLFESFSKDVQPNVRKSAREASRRNCVVLLIFKLCSCGGIRFLRDCGSRLKEVWSQYSNIFDLASDHWRNGLLGTAA